MKHNIGIGDRVVRFLGGILFIFAGVFVLRNNLAQGILLVLGIIAVLESFFGYCYLYRLFGINTCGKEKKTLWKAVSWAFILCSLAAYGIGWTALINNAGYVIPTEYWFYDAIAAGIMGIFFGMKSK